MALRVAPDLDNRLLGPPVEVYRTFGGERSHATFAEIEVFARQIVEQLAVLLRTPPAGAGTSGRLVPVRQRLQSVARVRKEFPRAYMPWTAEDDARLRARFQAGATEEELVAEFGRQPGGIRSRLSRLGLAQPPGHPPVAAGPTATGSGRTPSRNQIGS